MDEESKSPYEVPKDGPTYLYGSRARPFWFGLGSKILRELGEGAAMEYVDPPKGYLGAMLTNRPLPAELIRGLELTEL